MPTTQTNNDDLTKIPCKATYFWDRKKSGETILGAGGESVLNRAASKIWDLINEKNSIQDIVNICSKNGISQENVLQVIHHLEKTGNLAYLGSIWD